MVRAIDVIRCISRLVTDCSGDCNSLMETKHKTISPITSRKSICTLILVVVSSSKNYMILSKKVAFFCTWAALNMSFLPHNNFNSCAHRHSMFHVQAALWMPVLSPWHTKYLSTLFILQKLSPLSLRSRRCDHVCCCFKVAAALS